jgi:RNA polymerase sigma-70 factor (ECF subfamily)
MKHLAHDEHSGDYPTVTRPVEADPLAARLQALRCDSDEGLMNGICARDERCLEVLLERYWLRLVSFATGIAGSRDDASDVVQEVFLRVWEKGDAWLPSGSVSGYLYRIARNLALNSRRSAETRHRIEPRGQVHLVPETTPRPDEVMEQTSLEAEVASAVAALPERRREVFVLSRYHGLSYRDIAAALDLTVQTVANHMSAALSDLRERLAHRLP